jgi:hypothetical protein
MLVGVYAVAMPTLTRKGWRLPFASFFGDADEGEDEAFVTPFEMPRATEMPVAIASPSSVLVEEAEPLPPVVSIDLAEEEDDPTLTPLFEEVLAEVQAAPEPAADAAPADAGAPKLVVVHSEPAVAAQVPEPAAETPQPDVLAPEGDDSMLSLFSEAADAGKAPSKIREAVGDVTITDLQEEVRKLREIINKRAA